MSNYQANCAKVMELYRALNEAVGEFKTSYAAMKANPAEKAKAFAARENIHACRKAFWPILQTTEQWQDFISGLEALRSGLKEVLESRASTPQTPGVKSANILLDALIRTRRELILERENKLALWQ